MKQGQLLSVLNRTTSLHSNMAGVKRERYRVSQPVLRQVHREIRRLAQLLEAEKAEESFRLLRTLRRFSFLSAATPLPFDHPDVWPELSALMLHDAARTYPIFFPEARTTLEALIAGMAELQVRPANPIGQWLQECVPQQLPGAQGYFVKSKRYLVLADARVIAPVQAWVDANHLDLRVAKAGDFTDGESVDEQVFVGSSSWFPAWSFTAPRTRVLRLVQDAWLWDDATFEAHFGYNRSRSEPIAFDEVVVPAATYTFSPESSSMAEESERFQIDLPYIDWQRIMGREQGHVLQEGEEVVTARLHVLQGNAGVWLEVGEDETILGLELDVEAGHRVERLGIDELQPGDHVLLRTEGAGDYLEEVAEAILGAEGVEAHALHREWKAAVRKQLFRHQFTHRSLRALRDAGATRVSEHNLRSWSSDKNLRPGNEANFRALVEFAGMADRFDDIALAVRKLKHARLSAAQRIGHQIRNAVVDADVEKLRQTGRQDFSLPDGQLGGTLTAYTLLAIAEDTATISPSRVGRVFALQGEDFS